MQKGLIFLGIRLHNFRPMYLMECLPYLVVLNLCMANSLFLGEYLVSVIWRRSAIYFGQMRLSYFACGFPTCAHAHQCHACCSLARIKVVALITLNRLESLPS